MDKLSKTLRPECPNSTYMIRLGGWVDSDL